MFIVYQKKIPLMSKVFTVHDVLLIGKWKVSFSMAVIAHQKGDLQFLTELTATWFHTQNFTDSQRTTSVFYALQGSMLLRQQLCLLQNCCKNCLSVRGNATWDFATPDSARLTLWILNSLLLEADKDTKSFRKNTGETQKVACSSMEQDLRDSSQPHW